MIEPREAKTVKHFRLRPPGARPTTYMANRIPNQGTITVVTAA